MKTLRYQVAPIPGPPLRELPADRNIIEADVSDDYDDTAAFAKLKQTFGFDRVQRV